MTAARYIATPACLVREVYPLKHAVVFQPRGWGEKTYHLSKRTNETVHLAIREGRNALFIDHVAANHVIAVSGQTGEMVPLHCTAHGKALLTGFTREELRRIFGSAPLAVYTKSTIGTLAGPAAERSQIQQQGYTTDNGEYREGLRCVAAPIRAQRGMIDAELMGPVSRP